MFKLVDTFNGWEGTKRYATLKDAETALDAERKAFRSRPENMNSSFCKEVIPETVQWEWNHRLNRFIWQ